MNIRKQIKGYHVFIYLLFLCFLTISGCSPVMYDPSLKGKVIDDDTKEPIKGAVAVGTWTTWTPSPAGDVSNYYDICEAVSDDKGEFFLPGKGARIATNINPMNIKVFKA